MNEIKNYLSERIKTAIEILDLEIKRDKEALKTESYKEKKNPPHEPWDGVMLRFRVKKLMQEKARLEKRLHDR